MRGSHFKSEQKSSTINLMSHGITSGCCVRTDWKAPTAEVERPVEVAWLRSSGGTEKQFDSG